MGIVFMNSILLNPFDRSFIGFLSFEGHNDDGFTTPASNVIYSHRVVFRLE